MMSTESKDIRLIKFGVGAFGALRERLLSDLSREQFAMLFARTEISDGIRVANVLEARYFTGIDLEGQTIASLHLRKERVFDLLREVAGRTDADTIIDVHTHPFSERNAWFSSTDDEDERRFTSYLENEFLGLCYGSIVFSRKQYEARFWMPTPNSSPAPFKARIMTASPTEMILDDASIAERNAESSDRDADVLAGAEAQFNRSVLALGLDAMRRITSGQVVTIVGAGGLGAIIAENLVHGGFHTIRLIDPDTLSVSNLNRIVGATWKDAAEGRLKVDCLREHLQAINPRANIFAHPVDISDSANEKFFAASDWVIVATDNHASRFHVQHRCLKYSTPFISAGVNISVGNGRITDMSGEVITVRPGDNLCLSCLGRLDPARIAQESHFDPEVREQLVARGYVTGLDVKEPAVKTLNAIIGAMATDVLVNQYTEQQPHEPVWVYENNAGKCIYADHESVAMRSRNCTCHRCDAPFNSRTAVEARDAANSAHPLV